MFHAAFGIKQQWKAPQEGPSNNLSVVQKNEALPKPPPVSSQGLLVAIVLTWCQAQHAALEWILTEWLSDWVTESLTHSLELLRTTVVATNSTLTAGVPSPTGVAQLAQRPAGLFNHSRHQNQDNWVQQRSQVIREETPGCVGFFLFYLVERLIERCFELKKKKKKKKKWPN